MEFKIDIKKEQKEFIRTELRPVLYEHGFILSRPTAYVRECNGLVQEFYFKVEKYKLRPWVSCRPIFDARMNTVSFGTDYIHVSDCLSPYKGFNWVSYRDWPGHDLQKEYEKFQAGLGPLKSSIVNGVLPELDTINSLDDFVKLYEENGLFLQQRIQSDPVGGNYFSFIRDVYDSSGITRMKHIMKEMMNWDINKAVREYLQECEAKMTSDEEADRMFEEYCDKVRAAYKLIK